MAVQNYINLTDDPIYNLPKRVILFEDSSDFSVPVKFQRFYPYNGLIKGERIYKIHTDIELQYNDGIWRTVERTTLSASDSSDIRRDPSTGGLVRRYLLDTTPASDGSVSFWKWDNYTNKWVVEPNTDQKNDDTLPHPGYQTDEYGEKVINPDFATAMGEYSYIMLMFETLFQDQINAGINTYNEFIYAEVNNMVQAGRYDFGLKPSVM